jgi:hypothetical protein
MHLGSVRNMQKMPGMADTSVISIQPVMPPYNPFVGFGYPEPTVIRRPSILGNSRFPFPSGDPFDMSSSFPNFGQLPSFAQPGMLDMNDDKVPEGYEKVKETIEGPEGHQTIHTTYEKKNVEGPNQFYGIIVKIRPYKANNGNKPAADSPDNTKNTEDAKKQDDRRVAAESKPNNTEREVEESAVSPSQVKPNQDKKGEEEEKSKPTEEKKSEEKEKKPMEDKKETANIPEASPEKKDTDALAKDKSQSENEIPKSEEAPLITVNDNSKGSQ